MPLLANDNYPTTVAGSRKLIETYEYGLKVLEEELKRCARRALDQRSLRANQPKI